MPSVSLSGGICSSKYGILSFTVDLPFTCKSCFVLSCLVTLNKYCTFVFQLLQRSLLGGLATGECKSFLFCDEILHLRHVHVQWNLDLTNL